MSRASKDDWDIWVSKAEATEDYAIRLDKEAHCFPIDIALFLKAAKYSRKSAKHQRLASQSTDDPLLKSISLANHYIMNGNAYKSLGNFFYYSSKPSRAGRFFERAAAQHALAKSQIPPDLNDYSDRVQDSIEHQMELQALVADCNGMVAKGEENWTEALKHFRLEKERWGKLKSLGGNYARSLSIDAKTSSTEREIQICQAMISIDNSDFAQGLEHAEAAVLAAEKTLQEKPAWVYYQKALISAVSLMEKLSHIIGLLKLSEDLKSKFETLMKKKQSFLINFVSYKFQREVESHLRSEYQYTQTICNYKPPYLRGREIDVYASKGARRTTITICECKLKLNDQPISADEVKKFSELSKVVREYEQQKARKEGKQVTIYAWIVTNANSVEEPALVIAKETKIRIKQADIPKDLARLFHDVNWSVSQLYRLK